MAYGQDFGGRESRRLPEPAVPPEFEERVRRGNPQGFRAPVSDGWGPASGQRRDGASRQVPSAGYPGTGQSAGTPYGRQPRGGYWQQPYDQMPYSRAPYPHAAPRRQSPVGRNVLAGLGGAVVMITAIAVVAAASSSGHGVQSTGTSGGSPKSGGAPKKATIGTTITLAGNDSGEQMGVTVTKVLSDATPSDSFDAPPAGDRLYAVQFRLSDTGSAAYSDAPDNSATVIDSSGQSYQAGLETVADCQGFGGTENIAPGSSGLGCVTFEVPTGAKIVAVQFTLDSGMGPDTGQWDVTG